MIIRIRFARQRKPILELSPPCPDVVQDDFGKFFIGLADNAAGGFPSMQFAAAVAARQGVAA
jgi:hypothetical protein